MSAGDVSIARLHGEACWDCGAVSADLVPAGEVAVRGFEKTWPIQRCAAGHPAAAGGES
ncbi:hypothetical protein [Streptomyces sp. H27-S2]|uniref:hypothetical protein n=1 Tax=Streptomyces antarcticus TaxID=2996458 RepID=UPI00226D7F83|nr:hypothetical protein [Streptomyces sp. H27-S2]MCY0954724.1 hypothetical protein [Streptomyces sp. H27-S2]